MIVCSVIVKEEKHCVGIGVLYVVLKCGGVSRDDVLLNGRFLTWQCRGETDEGEPWRKRR